MLYDITLQALIDSTLVGLPQPINIPGLTVGAGGNQMTPVLCLMNMVDVQELDDDDEYEGIVITVSPLPPHPHPCVSLHTP